jgi:hypothetical protein
VDVKKRELLTVIQRDMAALQLEIDRCRGLIDCVLAETMDGAGMLHINARPEGGHQESPLRNVVQEAIFVLDESRRAFKSKRLEILRKKLTQALAES